MYEPEPEVEWQTSVAEADAQYAMGLGKEHPDVPWILSDRDVFYRNPYYTGPEVPHPDDRDEYDDDYDTDDDFRSSPEYLTREVDGLESDPDDDLPF